ncbi:hypothetical protein FKX85_12870 [Echinicola soli]|uniref:Secreted protein n=1 Tax=Echinicola soli TaxID=2591634 RepID=A0A514CJQ0_9BACT|nr:hypothetical protein [Echinicola soli]QDH79874.1 hypothetical protein FKX85_12870 [Echinicola soli]
MKRLTILLSLLISLLTSELVNGTDLVNNATVNNISMNVVDYYYTGQIKGDITVDCYVPLSGPTTEGEIEVLVYGSEMNDTYQLTVNRGQSNSINFDVYFNSPSSTDYITVYVTGEGLCDYQTFIYSVDSVGDMNYFGQYYQKPPFHPGPSC